MTKAASLFVTFREICNALNRYEQIENLFIAYFHPKNAIGKFVHSFNPTIHLRYKDFVL
ncbi:MAG: hypothetical protein ACP5MB_10055 [bacterium]